MTLRNRLFLIISIIVLVILGIAVALLLVKKQQSAAPAQPQKTPVTNNSATGNTTQQAIQNVTGLAVKPLTSDEVEQSGVRQFAKIFIERYYTYSSDSNFQNIRDVESLVSPSLWRQISGKLSSPQPSAQNFLGVTTRVFGSAVSSWHPPQAVITVQTQQAIEKAGDASTKNQNYTVTLVKQGTAWLVDGIALAQ